jgi:hypothetical protein
MRSDQNDRQGHITTITLTNNLLLYDLALTKLMYNRIVYNSIQRLNHHPSCSHCQDYDDLPKRTE